MADNPTIANVVTQISITGTEIGTTSSAPVERVVNDMVKLGLDQSRVERAVNKAVTLGVIEKRQSKGATILIVAGAARKR